MKPATEKPKTPPADADSPTPAGDDLEERICRRAHELFEPHGREDGHEDAHDVEHWMQAEQEIAGWQPEKPTN